MSAAPGPQPTTPSFELKDITKVCGSGESEVRALDDVNLRIDPGEFIAVVGAIGSGTSTCMNVIGCLKTPTDGLDLLHGLDVGKLDQNQHALLRRIYRGRTLLRRRSLWHR